MRRNSRSLPVLGRLNVRCTLSSSLALSIYRARSALLPTGRADGVDVAADGTTEGAE